MECVQPRLNKRHLNFLYMHTHARTHMRTRVHAHTFLRRFVSVMNENGQAVPRFLKPVYEWNPEDELSASQCLGKNPGWGSNRFDTFYQVPHMC